MDITQEIDEFRKWQQEQFATWVRAGRPSVWTQSYRAPGASAPPISTQFTIPNWAVITLERVS